MPKLIFDIHSSGMDHQTVLSHMAGWDAARFSNSNKTDGNDLRHPASLPAVLATFIPSLITAIAFLSIFIIIRKPFRRIYSPRTYIDVIPEKDQTPSSSTSRFEWIRTFAKLGDKFILEHSSFDAYLYLRFLRTIIFICFVGVCITWPILFPVNATGAGDASQLDRLGIGNVHDRKRLYAHAVVAWVFFGFVMFVVCRERMWLIGLRQAWYLSKSNAARLSSRTVLFLDPPKDTLDGDAQSSFGTEARQQWVVTATSELDNLVGKRDSQAMQLEATEVSFLERVEKKRLKLVGKDGSGNADLSEQTIDAARPVHKQYYLVGNDTDTIHYLRNGVKDAAQRVEKARDSFSADSNLTRSATFVEYANQSAAQRAYRGNSKIALRVPTEVAIESKLIGVLPKEIIWNNLETPHALRLSKKTAANALVTALIIFWSIPSAFVGSISNVSYLSDNVTWLRWIKNLPDPVLGLLSGLLPPLVTSLLASYVPIIMRYIAKTSGEPTIVSAELQVQAWYYAFQLIQVFFVTALSSSATAFVPKIINEPHQVPMMLADNLSKSSNFYLTYFILQGLGSSAKNVLNYSDLFQYIFFDIFINKTPRQKYSQYTSLKGIAWGKQYPKFTNFIIIALAYSCIAPLVLGFATVGLALMYLSYRYNLLFVIQPKLDTKGKCYTRALQQILSGLYVGELCLIGLFGLRKATGPSVMMAVLFFATIAYNVVMNRYLGPLEDRFPDELIAAEGEEEEPLLAAEEGEATEQADENSRLQRFGRDMHVPQRVLDPIARFFEPHIYASHKVMKAFLNSVESNPPEYSEEELRTAYMNPSLTSKVPVIWLPSEQMGLSKKEIEENSSDGIKSTNDGAWFDEKTRVQFDRGDLRSLPVWKESVPY